MFVHIHFRRRSVVSAQYDYYITGCAIRVNPSNIILGLCVLINIIIYPLPNVTSSARHSKSIVECYCRYNVLLS